MGYKALLTLDLDNKTSYETRKSFYDYLKDQKWVKLDSLTTVWTASFHDDITYNKAIDITKGDVQDAAKHSGVSSYDAAVQLGKSDAIEF